MGLQLLNKEFKRITNQIHDRSLQRKTLDLIANPKFEVNGKTYTSLDLNIAPAGKSHHHSYPGGYKEHVISATNIALQMCDSVERIYHGKVNRDFVIAGMLLHDLFKSAIYNVDKNGDFESAPLADLMDHLSIVTSELVRRDFPIELVHIVSAHHGEYGPIRPKTVEALICHLADFADSRLNGEVLSAASYITRRVAGQEWSRWTSQEAFEIVHSKAVGGWKGVSVTVEKLLEKRRLHKT